MAKKKIQLYYELLSLQVKEKNIIEASGLWFKIASEISSEATKETIIHISLITIQMCLHFPENYENRSFYKAVIKHIKQIK